MRVGHQIDVDGGFLLVPRRDPVRAQLDRIEAYRQDQIGFAHVRHVYLVDDRAQAGGARAQHVIFRHHAFGFVSRDKRNAPRFDEPLEFALGAVDLHAYADQRQRPPRFFEQRLDRTAIFAPRQRAHGDRRKPPRFGLLRARHVGRHVEMHGPRHRLARDGQAFAHLVERVFGRYRRGPFHERTQERFLIEDLVGVYRFKRSGDFAREHDDGGAIEQCLRDCGRRVRDARPQRRDQHAGLAGQLVGRIGHDAGSQFLLGQYEFDAGFAKRFEQLQHFAARYAERVAHAVLV
jgi:hypothetical protein